uniref:Cyclin-C n=1 Tax=Meloidogyne hapla TaxID=6305 RepID=A0A1I8BYY7_MELHA
MGQCLEKEVTQSINDQSRDKPILRMQAIASACVYFRRFYSKRSLKDIDPFLLAVTCINLASKVEEMGHLSPTKLINAYTKATKKWQVIESLIAHNHQINSHQIKGSEAEFCLVEILDCSLIVYHPYRSLHQFRTDMKACSIQNVDQLCQDAWRVCNDAMRSDAALIYHPHMIAIASIMIAAILNGRDKDKEKELKNWLADLNVDYEKIFDIQQMILNTYRIWRNFDEQTQLRPLIEKLPRPLHSSQQTQQQMANNQLQQSVHLQ